MVSNSGPRVDILVGDSGTGRRFLSVLEIQQTNVRQRTRFVSQITSCNIDSEVGIEFVDDCIRFLDAVWKRNEPVDSFVMTLELLLERPEKPVERLVGR